MKYMFGLVLFCLFSVVSVASDKKLTSKQQIEQFYQVMQSKHQFKPEELDAWFTGVEVDKRIITSISKPAEKTLTWAQYRKIFVKKDRINQGIKFWNEHLELLQKAEQEFGVPAEIIVGLIGVETRYGRIMGKYDIFRSLYTLAFHYPRRSAFFTKELQAFLVLAKQQGWQSNSINGSYAGAMGFGQFMPSSYLAYAVDFDGDDKIHLIDNVADAIGSVANYISRHGWRKGQPIVEEVNIQAQSAHTMLTKGIKPNRTYGELSSAGVQIPEGLDPKGKALLFTLKTDKDQYWLGHYNFYVISRYNPRIFYTKAVVELSEAIREAYDTANQGSSK